VGAGIALADSLGADSLDVVDAISGARALALAEAFGAADGGRSQAATKRVVKRVAPAIARVVRETMALPLATTLSRS